MPATILSHQAIVLPLKMRWPRLFSGLGLVLGSMAPDLEFIARMTDDWIFSHTVAAQIWFTIPVTLGLYWLLTRLLIPLLLPYVMEISWMRLHDLSAMETPSTVRQWGIIALSGWVGGMSHIFLDGMTHGGHSGWMLPFFPFLRTEVPQIGGPVPLYDALQCWLTVLLGIAALFMWRAIARRRLLWHWKQRAPEPQRIMPRRTGVRLAMISAVAAAQGAIVGFVHHQQARTPNLYAALLFGAVDIVFCVMVVCALTVWSMSRSSAKRSAPRSRSHSGSRSGRDQTLISA